MKTYQRVLFTATVIGFLGVPATAQDPNRDARCLMVSNIFSKSAKDPKERQAAGLASLFYLGRLDARLTPAQLEATFVAQKKTITARNAVPTMNACAQYMGQKSQALQAMGQRLSQSGRR